MDNQKSNKRKFSRASSLNLVTLEQLDSWGNVSLEAMGRTLDLSEGGIKLELDQPVPFLSEVRFKVALKEDILDVRGRVIHLKLEGKKIHCGVTFTGLSDRSKGLIRNFLKTKK